MNFNFENKSFLVTGAGRGIGRGLTKLLDKNGAKVYALGRTKEPLDKLVSECKNVVAIHADVRNWDDVREKLTAIEPLDGLVNNAAIFDDLILVSDCSKEDIIANMDTNLLGPINCMQVVSKKMIANKKTGSFVNISDISTIRAMDLPLGYCTSKAALDMASKQFALELGPHGIRVNTVNLTLVLTDTAKQAIKEFGMKDFEDNLSSHTPLGHVAEIEHVIGPILYLLSDTSSMVSGTHHCVDGGLQACVKLPAKK